LAGLRSRLFFAYSMPFGCDKNNKTAPPQGVALIEGMKLVRTSRREREQRHHAEPGLSDSRCAGLLG
jgi:hypothetical protein